MIEWLDHIDQRLFLFLNGLHSDFLDGIMYWTSGKTSWIFMYVIILAWLGYMYRWRMMLVVLLIAACVTLTDQISVHLFKDLVQRLRPCHNQEIQHLVHLVRNHCGGAFGFVSSHAANTFGVAMFTAGLVRNRYYSWFIFIWATLVAYSRIYLGVHYPGDVVVGAFLGIFIGWVIMVVFRAINKWISRNKIPYGESP